MLKVDDVSISYNKPIISNISFEIKKPSIISILGHNGEGKTTLMYALAGIIPNYIEAEFMGKITLNEKSILNYKRFFIFQDIDDSFLHTTVREELESLNINEEILNSVSLSDKINSNIFSLSYGEKHRLAIALAYGSKSDLIFMDESLSSLDYPSLLEIIKLIKSIKNSYVFISTHNTQLAYELSDEILIIRSGKLYMGKENVFKKEFNLFPVYKKERFYLP